MQLISPDINIDFVGKQKIALALSLILILAGIVSLVIHKGPKYGVDFAGGTLVQLQFANPVEVGEIRSSLSGLNLSDVSVQSYGAEENHEFLIRTSSSELLANQLSQDISRSIEEKLGTIPDIRRVEMVGPQVGDDLKKKALLAIFYSLLFIAIYISGRFELKWVLSGITGGALMILVYFLSLFNVSMPVLIAAALIFTIVVFWFLRLQFAIGAIIALIHDVLITVGIFSLLDFDFSLTTIAALLTIIGYSLNDTIIIFDRIRENIKGVTTKETLPELFNKSINQTLSRTILTSVTTLLVLLCLYFFGGDIIHHFAFAMIIGILVGTYSSVFVASPLVLAVQSRK